jgi:hypothetical protein
MYVKNIYIRLILSKKSADKIAKKEYKNYRPIQDKLYKSEYDLRIEKVSKAIKKE